MEKIDMVLASGVVAHNYSIDCLTNLKSLRSYFNENFKHKDIIKNQHKNLLDNNEIQNFCKRTLDNNYRILSIEDDNVLRFPYMFKFKGKDIKPLNKYLSNHIYSSIIRTILLDGSGPLEERVSKGTFVLYHYWFTRLNTFSGITHNVCIDLESMISKLIDKGLTLYKSYTNTNDIVDLLRCRLNLERLLNLKEVQ